MAKYCGTIGFGITEETTPGVWTENIIERKYCGDITRNSRRLQSSGNLNDDIILSNELSIVADPFANENFQHILYATYMGTKWKISNVDIQYPRLILTFGGVYNGQ